MAEGSGSGRRWPWILVAVVAGGALSSAIYPLVAEPENRLLSAGLIGASAVALWMAVGPLRRGRSVDRAAWLFPAGLVAVAAAIASSADTAFTVVFLVLAGATAVGLWFSRP
jgi:ABC-type Fe3+-siderophore transport system permease subunit